MSAAARARWGPVGWLTEVGVIVGLVSLTVHYCNAGRAADARWTAKLAEDSALTAAWVARDSTAQATLVALRADSTARAAELAVAAEAGAAALLTIRTLARSNPDTAQRGALERVAGAVAERFAACDAALTNCEARATVADSAARDARRNLLRLSATLDSTATRWRAAEARAGRRWYVVATGGYGFCAAGGTLAGGPTLSIGVGRRLWP